MRASDKIAFIGIGLFDEPTGISRAIQLMVEYFGPRAVVIVDNLQASRTHPIASGLVYVVNSPGLKLSIRRRLAREPLKLIDQYVRMTAGIFKILCHQKIERICCNTSVQFALLSPILLGIKAISLGMKITVLVYDPVEPSWCRNNLLARLLLWSGLASDIITVDVSMRRLLMKLTKRTPVHTVDFGVSAELVRLAGQNKDSIIDKVGSDLLTSLSRDTKSVTLLFYGRALERRRLQDLIVAFAKLRNRDDPKDVILYVGGYTTSDLPYIRALKTLAAGLGCLGKMRFVGSLTTDELVYLYHCCDIFIFPAVDQPWGLAPLEAMIFGKPVIVTNECGLSRVLQPRNLAVIARGRDTEDLAEKIRFLVEHEDARRALGCAGREFVKACMTFKNTGVQLERIWQAHASPGDEEVM